MSPKVYIKTYGCQMNVYDSQKIVSLLAATNGFIETSNIKEADLVLLNTCAIRDKAEQKLFSDLGRLALLKKRKPTLVIGVGGCVASQEGAKIFSRAPCVDLIFGPQTLHLIPAMYAEITAGEGKKITIDFLKNEKFSFFPAPTALGPSAFVTIMEGCNHFCSYCVVPHTRGREISRPFAQVLDECKKLIEQGVKEIHLLGQNVNAYAGTLESGGQADLSDLIAAIAAIKEVLRIRFTTSHPAVFSERLLQSFASQPKLVNHLHLPVQSGSDHILQAMRRGYTHAEYEEKIAKLRAVRPGIRIGSDFIVAFPGETEVDFEDTLGLVQRVKFDHSFSFIFSPRPNTKAALLSNNISLREKKSRLQTLQDLLIKQEQAFSYELLGKEQKILVAGKAKRSSNQLFGRTECNRVVNFYGSDDLCGQLVNVKITEVLANSLRGEVVE
jgi:tRNA-2-methylthio-N6-dimethylallyladenosine synthase